MTDNSLKFMDWSLIELRHSQTGELPFLHGVNQELYKAQLHDFDAKRAEALIMQDKADPLLRLRGLLLRGRFQEAEVLLEELKKNEENLKTGDLAEIYLERGRLAAFRGDWDTCRSLVTLGLQLKPSPVSQLTLHQTRALAHFELGACEASREDLNKVESLMHVLPHSISAFYAKALELRIVARDLGYDRGSAALQSLWQNLLKRESFNRDHAQVLFRTEVDLRRFGARPHFRFALASYLLAREMGEELYSSLALLDCYYSAPICCREYFRKSLDLAKGQFERVKRIVDEVNNHLPPTAFSKNIIEWQKVSSQASMKKEEIIEEDLQLLLGAEFIALPELEVVFRLKDWKVFSLVDSSQVVKILGALSLNKIRKEVFFKIVWGNQKYSPHLHDNLIYAALHRMKAKFSLTSTVNQDWICLKNTLVVS